eukprot:580520-Hanusia_phi.AAC.1
MREKVSSLLADIPSLAIVIIKTLIALKPEKRKTKHTRMEHGFMFITIQKLRFFLQGSSPFIPE